jgi:hypothetical protein
MGDKAGSIAQTFDSGPKLAKVRHTDISVDQTYSVCQREAAKQVALSKTRGARLTLRKIPRK